MFKLNLKIALRNLWKNRASSLINITGLAIGLASCLLLLLYVSYEWNFDKQGENSSRIYQVLINFEKPEGITTGVQTPGIIGPVLKQNYPGIEAMSRMDYGSPWLIANGLKSFKKNGRFADPDLLNIFDYTFIAGDQKTALNDPNNVILSESTARVLFGRTDVLNKTLLFDHKVNLKVTGVIKDLPGNVSSNFDFLMPWSLLEAMNAWVKEPHWTNNQWITLVKLSPSADPVGINRMIKGLIQKNASNVKSSPFLFSFNKLHLYDTFNNGVSSGGKIDQVILFMGLAIGVLLIACINFMNMATAKSEKRAKEVGVKKTIGATRGSLISQFLMESMVLTLCSAVMAAALIEFFLPVFNNILGIELTIAYSNPMIWASLVTVVVLTGLISGSYPAFYLSSFNPVQALRKKIGSSGLSSIKLRQVLVVGQFCFAVILMISTAVIYKQIQYIKNRPIGYQLDQLVEMPQEGELQARFEPLKEKLLQSGAVTAVCQTSGTMSDSNSDFWGLEWAGATDAEKHIVFYQMATTYDFAKTTGLKITAGRDFSRRFASDSSGVMLSQLAIKKMNLQDPIGKVVRYQGQLCTIVGVFGDFTWDSPFKTGKPMLISFNKKNGGMITMRLNTAKPASANLAMIERITKEFNPAYPTDIRYVDRLFAEKLQTQKTLGVLSNLFGGLAIFISCMGLFGLAAYSAEQRTKEIGVRKVLGASVGSLMQLLSINFLKMVMTAVVIAVPIASYIMSYWLKGFEFHTGISWLIIAGAAIGTLSIALLTVSFQAYRAANSNPVEALKYE
ncbi:cell division protein FtsX [Pedobacter sp. HMWF019]|uniref:ABC transporter permease n=1 Tax=Pedobacter sp. HMWF019 TaxID=2056856 RepID=UPI000D39FDB1|nr:ABC transporter permease [Pedobacter sp. HMWF019]PTT03381.1 cell division protein FtsX [Pedobacter sp. HMWF019]